MSKDYCLVVKFMVEVSSYKLATNIRPSSKPGQAVKKLLVQHVSNFSLFDKYIYLPELIFTAVKIIYAAY